MLLYDHPQYYEIAYSFRDLAAEVRFMLECAERYSSIRTASVLEVGCGHAPHAGAFAAQGVGYHGLDINPNMLQYAREKWTHLSSGFSVFAADMVLFDSPVQVDLAYVMLGSLYLKNHHEMITHFESIAGCLRSGGLYFLDWCVQLTDPLLPCVRSVVVNECDGIKVNSHFDIRLLNAVEQVYEETWVLDIDDRGEKKRLEMTEHNRAIFPQEFRLLIDNHPSFELVGWWYDWNLDRPASDGGQIVRPFVLLTRV